MAADTPSRLPTQSSRHTDQTSQVFKVTFKPAGTCLEIPADTSLLQAAELAGAQAASSCRNGTCRTCICQLVSGEVFYKIAWPGLSLDEKRDGLILPCVAYPLSDVVIELPM